MSTSQPPSGPQWDMPAQPPRSSGKKVFLILAIIFGVLLLICCGVVGGGVLYLRSYAKNAISQDPDVVVSMTRDITDIEIPAPLRPAMSMNMKVPFTDKTVMTMVGYQAGEKSLLFLIAMGDMFRGQNEEQMRQSMEQSLRQQGVNNKNREELQHPSITLKEVKIRGQDARFTIMKGLGVKTHTPRVQVNGVFQGKSGSVMLMLDAEADKLSDEKINAMLESIR